MEKRWNILSSDPAKTAVLHQQLSPTSHSLCKIFTQRGYDSFEKAKEFFNPSLSSLFDPFLLKGMDLAVNRILAAIQQKEKILLFGDYDVDGTAAVAMVFQYLSSLPDTTHIDYYIPDRYQEGYGISEKGIEFARVHNFYLIISLDCGISSVDLIRKAKETGISFIICDHHIPGPVLPAAIAILNPKQSDCNYPFKDLCGCGVAFKLISAINSKVGLPVENCYQYLDLVALATGADIVSLTGENRILSFHGLKRLNEKPCAGLAALKNESEKDCIYDNYKTVFQLAPRINAAGRMQHGRLAVELLIETDVELSGPKAKALSEHNEKRKQEQLSITSEALEMIMKADQHRDRKTTVVYKDGWHKGVLGIVASKLIETVYRPTLVLTIQDDHVTGSGRSIKGFNIYKALLECKRFLVQFGGHEAAAGLTLRLDDVEAFSDKFEEIVSASIDPELLIPCINIDAEICFSEIEYKFFNTIRRMEPFGQGNPKPVFITRRVVASEYTRIVGEKHIKFHFRTVGDNHISGIGFNMHEKFPLLQSGNPIDIVYTLDENVWNDQKSLQIKVIEFRKSASEPSIVLHEN